ncbi:MAG: DUF6340 family protein [Bacteroidales bacterium]|nr:DUF6340 family protein [Bacteroidales bacterium]
MKKFSVSLAAGVLALLAVCSCSPSIYRMDLQMRQPSSSGYDLGGKEMGVVYVSNGKDTINARNLAEGFANSLDDDYFDGKGMVDVYSMPLTPGADYSSRDTLLNLIMDTGKDVIFLVETQAETESRLRMRVSVYDSMGKTDTVRVFGGIGKLMEAPAKTIGQQASQKFLSNWRPENFYFYYYDTGDWNAAAEDAYNFRWHAAMDKWIKLAQTSKDQKVAQSAFNLATACYILGDYSLSERWLAIAEQGGVDDLTAALRVKLMNKFGAE